MKVTRIYTGDDQQSHFEELDVPQVEVPFGQRPGLTQFQTEMYPAGGVLFRITPQSDEGEFHPAPRRQFVITLTGLVELECGDGARHRFGPGDIMLADDTTGQGHISRTLEGPRHSMFVTLPDTLDVAKWRV
jgi:hypothetical protein